ncbi:MAG: hypothetical protein ACOY5W_09200 [Pseudomonadota bacterium]
MNNLLLKHSGLDRRAASADIAVPFVHYPYFLSRTLGGKNFGNIGNDLTFTSGVAGDAAIDAVAFAQAPWLVGDAAGPNYYCVAAYDAGEATETQLLDMLDIHGRGAILGFLRIKPSNVTWAQDVLQAGTSGIGNAIWGIKLDATSANMTISGRGGGSLLGATNFQALTNDGSEHRVLFLLDGIAGTIRGSANGALSSAVATAELTTPAENTIQELGIGLTINQAVNPTAGSRGTVVGASSMLANPLREVALFNVTTCRADVSDNLASIAAWWERMPAGYLPSELASLLTL